MFFDVDGMMLPFYSFFFFFGGVVGVNGYTFLFFMGNFHTSLIPQTNNNIMEKSLFKKTRSL